MKDQKILRRLIITKLYKNFIDIKNILETTILFYALDDSIENKSMKKTMKKIIDNINKLSLKKINLALE